MEYDHLLSAAGLVRNAAGQILMIRSPDRGWEYPGGMVEPGETIQEALEREIYEETGVQVEILALAGISKNMGRRIVNVDFLCRYVGGTLQTSPESLEVRWMTEEEALSAVTLPVTEKRLRGMLTADQGPYCFGFRKTPFETYRDQRFPNEKKRGEG